MKSSLLFLSACLILVSTTESSAQSPYYDALRLVKYLDSGELIPEKIVADILAPYAPDSLTSTTEVLNYFIKNPFIPIGGMPASRESVERSAASIVAGIGGIPVTTIAEGVAQFLIARTKEELNVTFFQRFKDELDKYKDTHLATLFAETYKLLGAAGDEIYQFNLYLTMLREAFKRDLSRLPVTIQLVLDDPELNVPSEIKGAIQCGSMLTEGLAKGHHPADILNDSDFTDSLLLIDRDLSSTMTLFNRFSQSLKSRNPDRYWVSSDSLALLEGPVLRIYFGLVYETIPDTLEINGDNVRLVMEEIADHAEKFAQARDYLYGLVQRANLLHDYLVKLRKEDLGDISFEDHIRYFNEVVNFLEYSLEVTHFPGVEINSTFIAGAKDFIRRARMVNDIFLAVTEQNYASAIFSTIILLDEIPSMDQEVRQISLKYGSFMAALAKADSADQVQDIIESVALPPGSSSIKRYSKFNVALNAYVGLMMGGEHLKATRELGFAAGVTAPVGIAISWGGGKRKNSHSVFLSLVDVGAITAYRFNDEESEPLPEVKLQNLLAPGLSYIWGISKCPVSLGFGAQMGPALRSIDAQGLELEPNYRFHAFIAVDIPIIDFRTVPK